jgi:hypothetical protein
MPYEHPQASMEDNDITNFECRYAVQDQAN